jgi:transposase
MARITYNPKIGRYLRENYESKTIAELAEGIGCGVSSIQRWSRRLGLTGKKRGNPHRKPLSVEIPPPR